MSGRLFRPDISDYLKFQVYAGETVLFAAAAVVCWGVFHGFAAAVAPETC